MSAQLELIYGRHAVLAALQARPEDIHELWLQSGEGTSSADLLLARAQELRIPVQRVNAAAMRRHTQGTAHQGVAARVRSRTSPSEQDLPELLQQNPDTACFLILDGVTDPHNLGACLRVAEAAGVRAVIAPARHQAGLTGSVFKSASGSAERVPLIQVPNLARSLQQMKQAGIWLYAASADAESNLWQTSFRLPWGIVVGSEGDGIRARTRTLCDFSVSIPMQGEVESLNVATASSVLLFEAGRQLQDHQEK